MKKKGFINAIAIIMMLVITTISNMTLAASAADTEIQQSGANLSIEASGAASLPSGWVTTYAISDGRITTYSSGGAVYGWIDGKNDRCQVDFSKVACGRVIVKYPTSKGTKTAYAPASAFLQNSNFNRYTSNLSSNTKVYTKQNMSSQIGTAYSTDRVTFTSVNGNKAQIIYPTGNNTYKMGFIYYNSSNNPQGWFDSASGSNGKVNIRGWAFDKDQLTKALAIHVYLNDSYAGSLTANKSRADVNKAYPGCGNNHGFDGSISTNKTGSVKVTVYAINVGGGSNTCLGTKYVNIPQNKSYNPQGWFDSASGSIGKVNIRGWAFDKDQLTKALAIHVYLNDSYAGSLTANKSRADVNKAYPGCGNNHGFDGSISTNKTGSVKVTVYAINVGSGSNTCLGTKYVNIPQNKSYNPQGYLDSVTYSNGKITVTGWCGDRDSSQSTTVHVYIDGVHVQTISASGYRPDVKKVYSYLTNYTGFNGSVTTSKKGTVKVDVYGINLGGGNNCLIGSKTISISNGEWQWPVNTNRKVTQKFGNYYEPMQNKTGRGYHCGIDIADINRGTPEILAAASGTVKYRGYTSGNGNHVIIQHNINGQTVYTLYSHLSNFNGCPDVGASVFVGQKIGTMGSTGNSTGIHLHFGIYTGSYSADPVGYATSPNNNKMTYNERTFYNPEYVIANKCLP